ncbi:TVP38/TMEM64 family protein [Streptomyces caniscabiei]|uniref:TVP38/TMEM64 family protein n=1 Tax=Streptomyces caniscabiei TaxID=2746961 RepID=UPI00299FAD11|nr:TVP38/TMEM64 family protein [Streptomyces caniscabiei]MDX2776583.1 TVP38/TMEM64 family protein [Streptomyces caniscabiei]
MTKTKVPTSTLVRNASISVAILATVAAIFYFWGGPLWAFFSDQEQAKRSIESAGIFGPLIFIFMQIIQVVVAPVPGQVAGLIGGYLFGPYLGVLYSIIGATIGFAFVFAVSRKFGRPLVERFFDKKHIEKFDFITKKNGGMALFLIFLLPAFPDDLICYLAGLTKIPIRTLILISIAGRLPGYLLLSFTGNGLTFGNANMIISIATGVLIILGLGIWQRAWLYELVKSDDHMAYIRQNWNLSRRATAIWGGILLAVTAFLVWAATAPQVVH